MTVQIFLNSNQPSKSHALSVIFSISNLNTSEPRSDITRSVILKGRIQRAIQWSDTVDGCLMQLRDGSLYEYSVEEARTDRILPSDVEPLLELCPWMRAIKDASIRVPRALARVLKYCSARPAAFAFVAMESPTKMHWPGILQRREECLGSGYWSNSPYQCSPFLHTILHPFGQQRGKAMAPKNISQLRFRSVDIL